MKSISYRERFKATIEHKAVDRVPFDLAGTSLFGIDEKETIDKLRDFLGFSGEYGRWYQKFDERILKHFDIDIRRVGDILEPESLLAKKYPILSLLTVGV